MGSSIYLILVLILFLFICASFFSASETSIMGASKPRIHNLAKSGNKKALMIRDMQSNIGLSLSAILLCNTLCLAFVNATFADTLSDLFGKEWLIYAPIIATFLITVYAETLPKIIAVNNPERVLMFLILPIYQIFRIFKPITLAINFLARGHLKLFGYRSKVNDDFAALEELRGAIDIHFAGQQDDSHNERAMMRSILELRSVNVDEIMVHRKNVTMLDAELPPQLIVEQVLSSPFTRLPLWKGEPDNIIGVIHAKALLRAVQSLGGDTTKIDISSLMSDPWFIPETTDLIDQLQSFKTRQEHFAIVVDEYGAFEGIVTLEDILEEIVGDIIDEHDVAVRGIRPQEDGTFVIDGTVTIRDVNRQLDWNLPADEEASTMAGLVIFEIRKIPEVGQSFNLHGYRFEILRRHRNQVTLLRVGRSQRAENRD